jgi:O-antigen/teichoic acid export membrane protein
MSARQCLALKVDRHLTKESVLEALKMIIMNEKQSAIKRVLENSLFYIFSSFLVKGFGLILLPVYTFYLDTEQYGILSLTRSFLNVALYIVILSSHSAVVRYYVEYKDNVEKLKKYISTIILFILAFSLVILTGVIIFRDIIFSWFLKDILFFPYILTAIAILFFHSIHTIHQNILKGMQNGKKLTVLNLIVFFSQVILNLVLIIVFDLEALGILLAMLIVNVFYFAYAIYDLKSNNLLCFAFDFKMLKESLKYSIPILPHNLSTNIASFTSRVFINNNSTISDVGLYGISTQFGILIDVIQRSVNMAFQPWFFEKMKNPTKDILKDVINLSILLLVIYSFVYMIIGLFSQEVILVFLRDDYAISWTVIPIVVIGFSIKSMYYFYVNILFFHRNTTRLLFRASLAGSFIDIILAYLMVPSYGMYGAAISFVLAKLVMVSIVVVISKKCDDIGYRVISMLRIIIPSILFMFVGLYFSYTNYLFNFSWMNLLYKIFILALYTGFVFLTNRRRLLIAISIVKKYRKNKKNINLLNNIVEDTN